MRETIRRDGKYFLVQYVGFSSLVAVALGLPHVSPFLSIKIVLLVSIVGVTNYLTWPLWKQFWTKFGSGRIGPSHAVINFAIVAAGLVTGIPLGLLIASVTGGLFS